MTRQDKARQDKKTRLCKSIEQMKERLNRAESIVFSIATPETNKKMDPSRALKKILGIPKLREEPRVSIADEHADDDSDDGGQDATAVNLANTSSSSADTTMETNSDQPTATIETEPQPEIVVSDKRL